MEQKEKAVVSLIIPVYQVSSYIERCLYSVINQTYNHFQCILVDDASPDDSIAKCERIIAAYEGPIQFRILHHSQNRGLSAARNTGMDAATGDYVLFIDSDDIISNDCVEKLTKPILQDHRIEMVFGGWMYFSDAKGMKLPKRHKQRTVVYTTQEEVRRYFYNPGRVFIPAAWNKLVSLDFLKRNNLRFREGQLWEDVLWSFFVMKHLKYLYSIPDVTYYYFRHPNSISTGTKREESVRQKSMISKIIAANFTPGEESREAAHYVRGFCLHYVRQTKTKELQVTAKRFGEALPFFKYPIEKTLFWAAEFLPRNRMGVKTFSLLNKHLTTTLPSLIQKSFKFIYFFAEKLARLIEK